MTLATWLIDRHRRSHDELSPEDLASRRASLVDQLNRARTSREVDQAREALARFDRQHPPPIDGPAHQPDRHAQIRGELPRPGVAGSLLNRRSQRPNARS